MLHPKEQNSENFPLLLKTCHKELENNILNNVNRVFLNVTTSKVTLNNVKNTNFPADSIPHYNS